MIEVTIETMYAEATKALGESIVRERLLAAEVQRLTTQVAEADARAREAIDLGREAIDTAREAR